VESFRSIGRAYCETAVAEALGRLDPVLYILDVLPNNTAEELRERLPRFLDILRAARPEIPIVLLGDRVFGDAAFVPERQRVYQEKNTVLQKVYDQAVAAGMKELHLHMADFWFGDDFKGTSDASHPNDLGAWRMANGLIPVVRKSITEQ
jgi:lysophospholipase L1-like esterase